MSFETGLIGPDFIGQLAERQLQNGLETDATALRANSKAWQQDRTTIQHLRNELQNVEDRLSAAKLALAGA